MSQDAPFHDPKVQLRHSEPVKCVQNYHLLDEPLVSRNFQALLPLDKPQIQRPHLPGPVM